ncbi:MAG: hypothetical protein MUF87_02095 [Anaerolineae bacterium]|nr:hypothetical protein [Anaerolineae bacterium]
MKFSIKFLILTMLLGSLLTLNFSTTLAQERSQNDEVFIYNREAMSWEDLQRIKGDSDLRCIQQITELTTPENPPNTFLCFDTQVEIDQQYALMKPAITNYYNILNNSDNQIDFAITGTWAVYSHVGYSGLISEIRPCSGVVRNAFIYSVTHWNNPNFSLEIYPRAGFRGIGRIYTVPDHSYWLTTPFRSARAYAPGVYCI